VWELWGDDWGLLELILFDKAALSSNQHEPAVLENLSETLGLFTTTSALF